MSRLRLLRKPKDIIPGLLYRDVSGAYWRIRGLFDHGDRVVVVARRIVDPDLCYTNPELEVEDEWREYELATRPG